MMEEEEDEAENINRVRGRPVRDESESNIRFERSSFIRPSKKNREILASVAAAFSAVGAGSVITWTSGATENLPYEVSKFQLPLGVTLMPLGASLGSVFSGVIAQSLGRKLALQLMALPCMLSWVILMMGESIWWFYIGRVLGGMAVGIVYTISMLYIAEVSRPSIRGFCCALTQILPFSEAMKPTFLRNTPGVWLTLSFKVYLVIIAVLTLWTNIGFTFGLLYALTVNVITEQSFYPLTAACMPIPFIAALLMQFAPETPQYLLQKHQYVKAVRTLQCLRGAEENIEEEFEQLRIAEAHRQRPTGREPRSIMSDKHTRKAFLISAGLMIFQQLSGINIINMNLENIAETTKVFSHPSWSALVIGVFMFIFAFIAAGIVDRVGRKLLLYISTGLMGVMVCVLVVCRLLVQYANVKPLNYVVFLTMIGYASAYSLGMGPIPWIILAEVMPQNFRGPACGMVSGITWLVCTLVSAGYFWISYITINYAIYAVCCFLDIVYIHFVVPETMGYTLEEIQQILD